MLDVWQGEEKTVDGITNVEFFAQHQIPVVCFFDVVLKTDRVFVFE